MTRIFLPLFDKGRHYLFGEYKTDSTNVFIVGLCLSALCLCVPPVGLRAQSSQHPQLWQSFVTPPDSIRVGCYYYWVNEQVDPKGVRADLQWMKDNGITLAFLATDIRNRTTYDNPWAGQTFGKNRFQSRLWWKNLRTALKTAGELGIEIGLFNCPGWSQSGGPWVKPDEAMRNWTPQGIEVCLTKQGTPVACGLSATLRPRQRAWPSHCRTRGTQHTPRERTTTARRWCIVARWK